MVTFSAIAGFYFSGNFNMPDFILLTCGVFLLSGGASALNQVQEFKNDSLMFRTRNRALVTGKLNKKKALVITMLLFATGVLLLSFTNIVTTILGVLNITFYNFVYTPLKSRTSFALFPGALVGAIPPLMGWAAAGASLLLTAIWFISIFVFMWQLPHFWLLVMHYRKDYEMAGFKCLPEHISKKQTRNIIFLWSVVTSLYLFLFPVFGIMVKPLQVWVLTLINLSFIALFYHFLMGVKPNNLKAAFIVLNSYLIVVLLFFVWWDAL